MQHIVDRIRQHELRFLSCARNYLEAACADRTIPYEGAYVPHSLQLIADLTLRGGKRVRMALAYEAARLAGAEYDSTEANTAALGIELLDTAQLIQDDIVDNSDGRRGGWSVPYALRHLAPHPSAQGLSAVVNDLGLVLALQAVSAAGLPDAQSNAMTGVLVDATKAVCIGQIMDIEGRQEGHWSEIGIEHMHEDKSARACLLPAVRLGLLAADRADLAFSSSVHRYGIALGVAYQVGNDYADMFSDSEVNRRRAGNDIRAGVPSVAIRELLRQATGDEKRELDLIIGNPNASDDQVDTVRSMMDAHQIRPIVAGEAQRYARAAAQEANTWSSWGQADALTFLRDMPRWALGCFSVPLGPLETDPLFLS
ncbi:Octaprenyl-diphosphate synthase [Actinomadura rubteroloni]|uniref:Octaprenyl-diphosphate synthase n=1 Tax=Actinomadura rubteroloni TaxID=1926885 RepID=A0A2P4UEV2_9ACTN|nr:polyprenyl synthetase family protein [Actinomadura rubteroloni]POM23583.1 Octaprenyl-diphosphate synthase [Actinomadura rubteroloni]